MSDPPNTPDATAKRALDDWIEQGPVRRWRNAHNPKVSLFEAAGQFGVGMSMMQMYEKGVHKPRKDKHATFAAALGDDWQDQWDAWLAKRPAPRPRSES